MSNAYSEVTQHAQDLRDAGIQFTDEQLDKAAKLAGERVRMEYEDKERQDPLVRLGDVLMLAVQDEDDKQWAESGIKALQQHRDKWIYWYARELRKAHAAGKEVQSLDDLITQSRWATDEFPTRVESAFYPEYQTSAGKKIYWPVLSADSNYDGSMREPSLEYIERVLHELGSISPDDSLSLLFDTLPYKPHQPGQPFKQELSGIKYIDNLPGITSESHLTVNTGRITGNGLYIKDLSPETVEKLIAFPGPSKPTATPTTT